MKKPKSAKPWTEAHKREARALWLEWWARRARDGADVETLTIREQHVGDEGKLRGALYVNGYPRDGAGKEERDRAIDSAVRDVRDFAERRRVRETLFRYVGNIGTDDEGVTCSAHPDKKEALRMATERGFSPDSIHAVRVLIRRKAP